MPVRQRMKQISCRKQCETERSTPEIEVVSNAAQKLDRQWIGIDITYLAINLIKRRLKDAFGEEIEFEAR